MQIDSITWARIFGNLNGLRRSLAAGVVLVVGGGCSSAARPTTVRMIYSPPREASCRIEVINVPPSDFYPGASSPYELIGTIMLNDSEANGDPFDPRRLELIRPEVCKLGGEKVSLGMNMGGTNGTASTYQVLKLKPGATEPVATTAAVAPQVK